MRTRVLFYRCLVLPSVRQYIRRAPRARTGRQAIYANLTKMERGFISCGIHRSGRWLPRSFPRRWTAAHSYVMQNMYHVFAFPCATNVMMLRFRYRGKTIRLSTASVPETRGDPCGGKRRLMVAYGVVTYVWDGLRIVRHYETRAEYETMLNLARLCFQGVRGAVLSPQSMPPDASSAPRSRPPAPPGRLVARSASGD